MRRQQRSLGEEILALVGTSSVTGTEGLLAGLLESRLREGPAGRGHRVYRLGDSVLLVPTALVSLAEGAGSHGAGAGSGDPVATARTDAGPPLSLGGRPLVVLAGHIDTVPRGDAPEPALEAGRIVGRGACDMKAGVAAMLRIAETLDPVEGFAQRVFAFYAGEEGPAAGNGLASLLAAHPWLRRAGLALLLEPTCGDLELGCSGSMHLAVTFYGKACHSARPWTGDHPLRHALPWLERILARPIRETEIAGVVFRELAVPTRLRAGEVRNVVPGTLEVNLNLRYPPDRTPAEAEDLARSLFPEGTTFRGFGRRPSAHGPRFFEGDPAPATPPAAAPAPGAIEVELSDHSPAGKIAEDAPLYRHLLESTGLPRRAKQGWTDVARFTAFGVPALNWGPGDPAFAHTRDEFADVRDAETFVARLQAYLLGSGPGA